MSKLKKMKPLPKIKIGRLTLKNPVMVASGTFGYAEEFKDFFNLGVLGAVVTKTITLHAGKGNKAPRIFDLGFGVLNSIGLENPGVKVFREKYLKFFSSIRTAVITSIYGYGADEWTKIINNLDAPEIAGFELNFSCPNLKKEIMAYDPKKVYNTIRRLRKLTKKPLIAKLSYCHHIKEVAVSAQKAGADAITAINTLPAVAVNTESGEFILGNIYGGLSGPCIRPLALKCVYDIAGAVKIPVIGCGGIRHYKDILEFFACGAKAVQIGTANLTDPLAAQKIIKDLKRHYEKKEM